jgi:hypothetical protein
VFNGKRAPTLALGLFLYLLLPGVCFLEADENFSVSADAGSLLVGEEGSALYWRSGFSFKSGEQFYSDIVLGQVVSSLPWAEGAVFGGRGKLGFGLPRFGFDVSYGFFHHAVVRSKTEAFSVYNNEGRGFFIGLTTPVQGGEWSIAPSFLYGSGSWADGSLYWFFGKPRIPALAVCGVSLGYRKQHELAFQYLGMDMDIFDNDAGRLFDSRLEAYIAWYRFSLEILNLRLGGSLGGFYAGAEINGTLTAANQHFVYFPYNSYAMNGSFDLCAAFGAVDLQRVFSFFQCRLVIGALYIFQGNGLADIQYKKKTLFGGEEGFEAMSLDMGGAGAAIMLLDAGFLSLRPGRQKKALLSLGLRKLFVVPWGYEQVLPGASGSSGISDISVDRLLQTVLFSGLSFYGSLCW